MGSIYAEKQGENKNVALGIFEHYLPRYQGDILPTTIEGALAGIADKMDTVIGCFSVGLKPTSSKDPYALRRAVQGIVYVTLSSVLEYDYKELIKKSYEIFSDDKKVTEKNVIEDVTEFFKQRIINVLSERYNKDLINYEIDLESNIVKLDERLKVLSKLSKTENFDKLINLLKRVKNILKDEKENNIAVNENLFNTEQEKNLLLFINKLEKIESSEFETYTSILIDNEEVINDFFDKVIINDKNTEIKNNRISLLKKLEKNTDKILNL